MAEKREFTFHIKTLGDPSGAKDVEQAIDSVVDAAEALDSGAGGGAIVLDRNLDNTTDAANHAATAIVKVGDAADSLGTSTSGKTLTFERNLRRTGDAATDTEKRIAELERTVKQLNAELARSASNSANQAAGFRRVGESSDRLGESFRRQRVAGEAATKSTGALGQKVTQAGYQMQDFAVQVGGGTSALTALAQQGSQFLGVFGPKGAIAGAALAIGVVVAQLIRASKGTKNAKEDADDWVESLKSVQKIFQDMETVGLEEQSRKLEESARRYADEIASINAADRRAIGAEGVAARRIEGERLVALANNRLEIARTESALLRATAEEATRLAERRKRLAEETAEIELAILERRRELDLQRARRSLVAAERNDSSAKDFEARARATYNKVAAEREELFRLAQEAAQARFAAIAELRNEIKAMIQEIEAIESEPFVSAAVAARRSSRKDDLRKQIELNEVGIGYALSPGSEERDAKAKGDALVPKLSNAADALKAASEEQRKTSASVADAMQALKDLRDSQSVDRDSERQVREAEKQIEAEKGPDTSKGVEALSALTKQLDGIPELAGVTEKINSFIADKTLTGEELVKSQVLISQYFAKIANLGATQNAAIREARDRVDDLEREVRTLRANQRNTVPAN
ncbi:hypothetical protein OKA04_12925 [Luteolibacter flavescens]|uniref:Bacteriophage tail tape measure N-terminal domain-containing protein n=1 Tax=Luteolibacter flavescens TaxID=1859460 RepID=A0ABT3FPY5_9BACT|nr:hypothetical protein [Luteolibacter flavescens]MCW1885635.1 hypothetical protein [Luteolibacter flavescens]